MEYEDHLSDEAMRVLRFGFGLRVASHQIDDALARSFDLAQLRTDHQYGRPPTPVEVALVGSLLCWYPLKGPPSKSYTEAIATVQAELLERGTDAATTSALATSAVDFLTSSSTDDLLNALVRLTEEGPTTGPAIA